MARFILQVMKNLSYHQKTASGLKSEKKELHYLEWCCRFCVYAIHQKRDVDSTYIAPASWRVMKDYVIPLTI